MSSPNLARLIYLAAEHKPELPSKQLMKSVPQGEILQAVVKLGLQGAGSDLDVPLSQLQNLYNQGKVSGKGSDEEFRTLLGQVLLAEADLRRDQITMGTYLGTIRDITNYVECEHNKLIASEEVDLGDLSNDQIEVQQIPKFDTGFSPLDVVVGGLYQGISTIIGRPGHGKTSIMLSIMESVRQVNAASSVWMYDLEVPKNMMVYRVSPAASRTKFIKGKDRLVCGFKTILEVEQEIIADPDPDRILIVDSPDVMAGGTGEGKRYAIEEIYMGLIRLKQRTKSIIVTSWPRRKDTSITLESGAEAWAKAWYSDVIVGLTKLGRAGRGNNVRLNVVKNRFGSSENDLTFQYNYSDLTWDLPESSVRGMEHEDDW